MPLCQRFPLPLLAGVALFGSLISLPIYGARPCADNYSETGEWATGRSTKSFITVKGTTADKALVAIGRRMAKEGYQGIAVNKDLGLVSGASGTGWTLNVTVSETDPTTLRIDAVESLVAGRRAVVSNRTWLCELLEETIPVGEQQARAPESFIALNTKSGTTPLRLVSGQFRETLVPFLDHKMFYFDYVGLKAEARSAEKRPVLVVRGKTDPARSYVLVRCETDDANSKREIKIKASGNLRKEGYAGVGEFEPDEDWILPFATAPGEDGTWRMVPSKDLKRGEYGLWDVRDGLVALFGID